MKQHRLIYLGICIQDDKSVDYTGTARAGVLAGGKTSVSSSVSYGERPSPSKPPALCRTYLGGLQGADKQINKAQKASPSPVISPFLRAGLLDEVPTSTSTGRHRDRASRAD